MSDNEFDDAETTAVPTPKEESGSETKVYNAEHFEAGIAALEDPPTQPVEASLVDEPTRKVRVEKAITDETGARAVARQKTVIRAPTADEPARPFPQRSGDPQQIEPDAKTEFSGTQIPRLPQHVKEARQDNVRHLAILAIVGILLLVIAASLIVIFS